MEETNESVSPAAGEILSQEQVAGRYQVSPYTVKEWRRTRTGPAYFYAGRQVRYRLADLRAWEKRQTDMAATTHGQLGAA